MVLTTIHFLMMTAVTVFGSMTMALKEEETLHPLRLIGIISLILSIVSIVVTFIFTEESPVALIRQKMKREALQVMIKVRSETEENVAIRNEFNELKAMVEEDELNNKGIFSDGNARPLLIIFLMKAAFVLSFNYPLNMVMLNSSTILDDKNDISVSILSAARMIPMVVVLFTIEIGRRPHFLLGSTGAAILLIGLGIIFQVNETPSNNLVLTLIIAFQIFAGIGLGHISDVMASEAFNSLKKARSIAFVTSLELILQMILIAIFQLTDSTNSARVIILSACGACILPITILLYFKLPETAKMSIRQTRSEFAKRGALVYSGTKMPTEGINVF